MNSGNHAEPFLESLVELTRPEPGIAVLRLNDPDRLNSMSDELAGVFAARLRELAHEAPRVVVLTGSGRAFSAGGNLAMLEAKAARPVADNQAHMFDFYQLFLSMLELQVPLVAAVNGLAVGAGFCLACACDIRIADPAASFSAPFLKLGLFPGMGSTVLIPRALGPKAADLLLTGRRMLAEEAFQSGLISRLSPPGQSFETALEAARQIVAGGPQVTRQLLALLRIDRLELLAALRREAHLQGASYAEAEFRDGIARARSSSRASGPS